MRIQSAPVLFGHNHNGALREKKEKLKAFLAQKGFGNEGQPAAVGLGKNNLHIRVVDEAARQKVLALLQQPGQPIEAAKFEGADVIVVVSGKMSRQDGCCGNNCCGH